MKITALGESEGRIYGMLSCIEDNEARLSGVVEEEPIVSHVVRGEKFCKFYIRAKRLSENEDIIACTVPEKLVLEKSISKGDFLAVSGQFRSYNNYSGVGNKLVLTMYIRSLEKVDDAFEEYNELYLNGYICKEPVFRITPFGREITDILLAVNRAYNKSDYIPCIAWGKNARLLKNVPVGTNLKVWGRMQSRNYEKKINDSEVIKKTAYEVSINKIEIAE